MRYTVEEINNNVAKIVFGDSMDIWELNADMTEADLDDLVFQYIAAASKDWQQHSIVLSTGQTRTATAKPAEETERGRRII